MDILISPVKYAPEQTKVFVRKNKAQKWVDVSSKLSSFQKYKICICGSSRKSVSLVREYLFKAYDKPVIGVLFAVTYEDEDFSDFNRKRSWVASDNQSILSFYKGLKKGANLGPAKIEVVDVKVV